MALEASSLVQRLNKEPAVLCNKYIRCVCVCVCRRNTLGGRTANLSLIQRLASN